MGYSISCRGGVAGGCYGYKGLSGRVAYSLAMPKSYGTDVNIDSYLHKAKKGLDGYVANLAKYAATLTEKAFYPKQEKKDDSYKIREMILNYDPKRMKGGATMPATPEYDLPSMRRPVIRLEGVLN